jgi:hypothetical protein
MAYFAKLQNQIVIEVHSVANEALDPENEESSGIAFLTDLLGYDDWKQTSFNGRIRYNYAGIGYVYDSIRDAFIPPKCHDEATINELTCQWDCSNAEHQKESLND